MGVCKIARWFKTATRSDRDVQPVSSTPQGGRNEYYRNLLQQFANHCQAPNGDVTDSDWIVYLPKEQSAERSSKRDNRKLWKNTEIISGVPHIRASEIFEIGCVAGTESRCLELISAEWHNTKVTLKRSSFSTCRDAIKAEVEILSEIRHPNILLLMATTLTNERSPVSIFEPVDCTLYNYIHEQGERINIQGILQIGIKLADALKYCHMRGYIHTAISSHCVYFASDKTVKLGGWELAREIENFYVEKDYERYLRVENFKWQAPALSYEWHLSKKIDVYCLMLLLWEMCTGSVPWSGCEQSNVERQYMMQKRDIVINLQKVPPILRNLLEAGLHRDETKITLDMDKIGRKLHRLLMIYEEDEMNSTCISEGETNNDLLYNDTLCRKSTLPLVQNKAIKKPCIAQLHRPIIEKKSSNQSTQCKKEQCTENLKSNSDGIKSDTSVNNNSIVSPVRNVTPCTRCVEISHIVQEIDEKTDARANIKRLKELIASKREDFFYGNDSSTLSYSTSPKATSTLLSQDKSPTYIQCKPASHTTTMEPKCNTSPIEYRGNNSKSSYTSQRKTPYMGMPASIKNAIIQPQILHSDTKSFYESTLWRKEKEICISRMAHNIKKHQALPLSQQLICSITPITDDDKAVLTTANATYTIEVEKEGNPIKNNLIKINHTEDKQLPLKDNMSEKISISPNKSIQNLENALDRARKIICSGTACKVSNSTFSMNNNTQECETVYKNSYVIKHNNQEIKVNNRSTFDTTSFLGMDKVRSTQDNIEIPIEREKIFNEAFINNEMLNSAIMKMSNRISVRNQQSTKSQEIDQNDKVLANVIMPTAQNSRIRFKTDEEEYIDSDTLNDDTIKYSPRRCSLPTLNNLAITHTPKLTHKKNAQGNQYMTEDIYIDDEFGSKLNYNLVLLDDDYEHLLNAILNDNESLPQTTEL